ncbi:hypothetical protein OAR37_02385 [Flavobacteriaceae bacterium]|uniref:hypothetical protein n=1 Tax=Candidatus Arcticimaribacter forsetii TaxID=2820661 RepID=UPI002076DEFD|nr:hypothetical protein [Candidatus Arcticimaribacter forsetii]MDA8640255.1 hypothetical protein [Flavobacteriaceae bacterium]MDB4738558.1 hypothetical protein [Flavobacteriaceae bacterium]MDC0960261.1 hypothetical protein [Flavobacteriaceae bacterium]
MKNFLNKFSILTLVMFISSLISCSSDPETIIETVIVSETVTVTTAIPTPDTETVGSGGISYIDDSQTWSNDRIWIMNGKIVVRSGASLTIEPGTIVKAQNGQGVNATALVIAAGATINAVGTSDAPIIFTDIEDSISYGDGVISPNRESTDTGKWGGIIVLGNAIVGEDGGRDDIEGIAEGFDWTSYGGDNDSDSSGSISYVSIRHSGTQLAGGDEIQGLTLGGVGSGTDLNNIEVVGSNDDGVEIFGGAAVLTDILILNQRDDAIDIDEGYRGSITNVLIQMRSNSDNPFEIDGTEDSTGVIGGSFTINNATVYGNASPESGKNNLGDWKSDATGLTNNVVYKNIDGLIIKGIDTDTYGGVATEKSSDNLNFNEFYFITTSTLDEIFVNTSITDYADWARLSTTQIENTGADESLFSWTLWSALQY